MFLLIFFLQVFHVRYSSAETLSAVLAVVDQSGNAAPTSLNYYWAGTGDTSTRQLTLKIYLATGLTPITDALPQPATINIVCSQSPANDVSYSSLSFTPTTITIQSSAATYNVNFGYELS